MEFSVQQADGTPRHDRGGRRVLVAEDQPINARLIRLMLERLGIAVELVSDGPAVLEYLRERMPLPGAVLLDMRMPGMDGTEVARRIRAGEAGAAAAQLPLIAVTGNALESDRIACLEAGMNHHLPKPVTPGDLERVLTDVGLLDEGGRGSDPPDMLADPRAADG